MKRSSNSLSGSMFGSIKVQKQEDGTYRATLATNKELEGKATDQRQAIANLKVAMQKAESDGTL